MFRSFGRLFLPYLVLLGSALGLIFYLVKSVTAHLAVSSISIQPQAVNADLLGIVKENLHHSLPVLLIQIIAIIAIARFLGLLFSRLGQPSVIGEILAGILLGPSLLGHYFPEISSFLFPIESLDHLQFLSQIGLILFMFVIGMELDISVLKSKAKDALFISHSGIILAFTLGVVLAYLTYHQFMPDGVRFIAYALFLGISMSITAFPVLARILQERGLTKTKLGAIAITSAASDDITAWCLLAMIIAIVKAGSIVSALTTIALSLAFVLFMLLVMRPFLHRVGSIYTNRESISRGIIAMVFIILLSSAWATEVLGIHALFGAFLSGVVMPPNMNFRKILVEKMEDVSVVLLLPLFFVYTGLRTELGLLNTPELWITCLIIIGFATFGKVAGASLSARYVGQNWKESLTIGALMNTRGLMELIVLNIGYELGILSPEMFAMLVLMALVTTFTTGPMLSLVNWAFREKYTQPVLQPVVVDKNPAFNVLISFGLATSGRKLLKLAHQLYGNNPKKVRYSAVHVTLSADVSMINVEDFERQSFKPIRSEADKLNIPLETHYRLTTDLHREVNAIAERENTRLLIVGAGQSLYTGSLLGNLVGVTKALSPENLLDTITGQRPILPTNDLIDEKARVFLNETECDVAVLLDRDFSDSGTIFVPLFAHDDIFLLDYAQKFIENNNAEITVADTTQLMERGSGLQDRFDSICKSCEGKIAMLQDRTIHRDFLARQELMLVSYKSWKALTESKSLWLEHIPSVLVIRPSAQIV